MARGLAIVPGSGFSTNWAVKKIFLPGPKKYVLRAPQSLLGRHLAQGSLALFFFIYLKYQERVQRLQRARPGLKYCAHLKKGLIIKDRPNPPPKKVPRPYALGGARAHKEKISSGPWPS